MLLPRRLRSKPADATQRDLNGDANPEHFRYQARWQVHEQRIEMALVSTRDQTVHLAGDAWFFAMAPGSPNTA